jgi:hypothetical protein
MLKFDTPPTHEEERFLSEEENFTPERFTNCLRYLNLLLYARRNRPAVEALLQEGLNEKQDEIFEKLERDISDIIYNDDVEV